MTKVLFTQQQKTKTIELPSYPGSQVVVKQSFTIGENRAMIDKFPNASDPKHPDAIAFWFEMVKQAIVSWNFTTMVGDQEVDMEITEENIRQFPVDDFTALQKAVTEELEKKKGIERNKCFTQLIGGQSYKANTPEKVVWMQKAADIILCKYFKRSYQEIQQMPSDFYDDCLLWISLENAHKEQAHKKAMMKAKRK